MLTAFQASTAAYGVPASTLTDNGMVFTTQLSGGRGGRNGLELTAALSSCHLLRYLHLCAVAGVSVMSYTDAARGVKVDNADGSGHFTEVVLRPQVTVASAGVIEKATTLHDEAHAKCFVANSVNFPVRHEPIVTANG
jgi:organic hydroperoxide reductase OsmC/OhrA